MSSRFTRNLSEVKDVNKLSQNVTTQNDLVQTTEGDVFVVTKNGYQKITGGLNSDDLDKIKTDIKNLKSENTKLKNRVSDLETSNTDLVSRVEALETIDVTGVTLDKSTLSLEVGDTATLNATISPDNASYKAVKFTSSDEDIATVDDNGLVTAVAEGSAEITVESLMDGSKKAKCTLTVTEPPTDNGDTTT